MATIRGGYTMKPHVYRFADALEKELGQSLSFGTYAGHSPPEGPTQAVDIFTPDNQPGYDLQDRICDFARKNARKFGVRYCIRRVQIWNIERDAEGWRNQNRTGNRTADHYDHVHITFYAVAEGGDEPVKPKPVINKENSMSMYVRFRFRDQTPGTVGKLDWIFDGPSRIFAPVGSTGVLTAADKTGCVELGDVEQGDWDWFSSEARKWENG